MAGYIGSTVSAELVRVSNTSLFHLAARYLGDATLWYILADLNNIDDPWIVKMTEIKIPDATGVVSNGGVRSA